jgi:ATP-binding cassette subfamily F protein 3
VSILTATGLSQHFGAQDVFDGVSVQIAHGERAALVGPNGTGKTTLLRILAGLETPSAGQVFRAKGLRLGYLPQEVTLTDQEGTLWDLAHAAFDRLQQQAVVLGEMEAAMSATADSDERDRLLTRYGEAQAAFELAGGYSYEHRIRQVLGGLGFDEADFQRPLAQLSGGQQTRAHLARLLLDAPDLLLLDEPTNHLDIASVEWLEGYLQSWPGALVAVAHDRYFLDEVATRVWDLSFGRLEVYRGNYSAYLQRRQREFERQQAFVAQEENFIRRNIAGQRTREAQGRRKRLERLERVEQVSTEKHIKFDLNTELRSGDLVLATYDLAVGYEADAPLFTCPDLEIRRGDRVALLGPNGAGKTTFVKTILKQVKPLAGRVRLGAAVEIGYFAQAHAGLDPNRSVLDEILSVENLPLVQARGYLGRFLFSGDDVFKPIGALSGGERARVALAKLTLHGANFLVLDEPTNHLDIPSQEILQEVLSDFSGTILLVSHDRYFLDALATQVWALEDGTLYVSRARSGLRPYGAYLADRQARRAAAAGQDVAGSNGRQQTPRESQAEAEQKREQLRRRRALAELEVAIQAAEARLADLSAALEEASYAQAVDRLQELGRDYRAAETELGRLLNEWTAMEAA